MQNEPPMEEPCAEEAPKHRCRACRKNDYIPHSDSCGVITVGWKEEKEKEEEEVKIYWYMEDPRFEPGTVADIGNIRLYIRVTERQKNNKWRLYMAIRTRKENGVKDNLKREVLVAEWDRSYSLREVQGKTERYLRKFITDLVAETRFWV